MVKQGAKKGLITAQSILVVFKTWLGWDFWKIDRGWLLRCFHDYSRSACYVFG